MGLWCIASLLWELWVGDRFGLGWLGLVCGFGFYLLFGFGVIKDLSYGVVQCLLFDVDFV